MSRRNEDLSFERDQQIVHIANALLNNSKNLYDISLTLTLDELPHLLQVSKKLVSKTPHIIKREFIGNKVGGVGDIKAYLIDGSFEREELKFTFGKQNNSHGGGGTKLTQAFSKDIILFNKFDKQYYPQYFSNLGVKDKKTYHNEWRRKRTLITEKYNLDKSNDGPKISQLMYEEFPETGKSRDIVNNIVKPNYTIYFANELNKLPIEEVYRVCMGIMSGLRKPKDLDNFTLENSKYVLREINVTNMGSENLKIKIINFTPKKSITKIIPNSQQLEIHFCDKTKLTFPLAHGNGGQGSLETYTLKVMFEA
jgi:hypothetical protein